MNLHDSLNELLIPQSIIPESLILEPIMHGWRDHKFG
jgi:hypothetical protein